jgi:CPA1 family monovalent cation:H+ antiporter
MLPSHFDPVVVGIAVVALVVTLTAVARQLPVPTPILQLIAGFLVGLIPGISVPDLSPNLVFSVFLPPILWSAAMFTSLRDFSRNIRPIGTLAVGLVLITAAVVAIVAHALLPGLPWAAAVALGAIVSPPDAVAATAIVSRLPVPRRVITVLEGESLMNDATALVLYRTATIAAVTGAFSWGESVVRFFIDAGVGALLGLFVAWLTIRVACLTKDALTETLLTLAAPYVAWIAGETLHVSAVLACVAGGVYLQQRLSTAVGPASRLQIRTTWDLLVFVLNSLIFLLLGTQVSTLLSFGPGSGFGTVVGQGVIITLVVVAVRAVWVPLMMLVPALSDVVRSRNQHKPSWRARLLISWTSMRGVITLATALALPRVLADGRPFPYRNELVLIALCVIVFTLVVQGLSLAPLIRVLHFAPEQAHAAEERLARREATRRAAETLEDLSHEDGVDRRDVEALRAEILERLRMTEQAGGSYEGRRRLRLRMIKAERRMLIRLRNEGAISDEVLRALELELDLEAVRAGAGDER